MNFAAALLKTKNRVSLATVWGVFNSFALKGLAVVMTFGLITLAARGLGGHDFGTFSILFSTAGLFSVIGTAGQQILLMRSWNEYGAQNDVARLKGALIYGLVAAGIGSTVSALAVWAGLSFFYSGGLAITTALYLFFLSFALISSQVTRTAVGVGAGDGLANFLATIVPISYLIACAIGGVTPDLVWLMGLLSVGKIATFGAHAVLVSRKICERFPEFLKVTPVFEREEWGARSLKLWVSNALESANQYVDVLIVGILMNPTIAGAYFVTTRLANAFAIASDAMYWYSSRHIPDLYYRGEKQKLDALLNFVASVNVAILAVGMAVVIIGGHWLLSVFNPAYEDYYLALVLLCFGTAAVTAVGPSNSILMFTGHEGTTLKVNAVTVLMRTLGFFVLVPFFDVTGAVIASTLAFWFMALVLRDSSIRLSGIDGSISRLWMRREDVPETPTPVLPVTSKLRTINVILPRRSVRGWHMQIVDRLKQAGHPVNLISGGGLVESLLLDLILRLERIPFNVPRPALAAYATPSQIVMRPQDAPPCDLTIDLSKGAQSVTGPVLRLVFSPGNRLYQLAAAIAANDLPDITAVLNGEPLAIARPMIDNREVLSLGLEDVLARAVTLTLSMINEMHLPGALPSTGGKIARQGKQRFLMAYFGATLPGLVREVWRRKNYRFAHWRVGYRFIDGPGVAETGTLAGADWLVLPDDGSRFYADPFAFTHKKRSYIFVEDYVHASGKAIISVAEVHADGSASVPQPIIEEPWHLSYPQVFARDGDIWMLPEASAGEGLVLYRAEEFPHKWVRHKTLIAGQQLSDATLLVRGKKLWLFATDKDGAGSTSDTLVVYSADSLEGPWIAHVGNPIVIDRANARPGGAFVRVDGKLMLPVQDGTDGYGGGLGLCEITKISAREIGIAAPKAIDAEGYWPYPRIHTLNRQGRLEVIDGIAAVRK